MKDELDIELYKIEVNWWFEVKEEKYKFLLESKDIMSREDYIKKYEKFVSDFNEIGKLDLVRYVVYRKIVIEFFEELIESNNGKFENEDLIYFVFFFIRIIFDEVFYDK